MVSHLDFDVLKTAVIRDTDSRKLHTNALQFSLDPEIPAFASLYDKSEPSMPYTDQIRSARTHLGDTPRRAMSERMLPLEGYLVGSLYPL